MKFKQTVGACLSAALMLATLGNACSAPRPASIPDDPYARWKRQPNEQIVFMSRADAPEGELYRLDKDGKITRLTANRRHENHPALSSDGGRVAFTGGEESDPLSWERYVLDLQTGEESRLTANRVIDAHPDWSPDGTRLVFGSFRDAQGHPSATADLYVLALEGHALTQLTDTAWEDNDPEWSPDGSRIAFKSTRHTQQPGREEIYVMESDGAHPRRLTTTHGWQSDHDPSWSPSGEALVFNRFEGSRPWLDTKNFAEDWQALTPWNIHQVTVDGHVERLTNSEDAGWGVAVYTADGEQILFGKVDWIIGAGGEVIGGHHRLILMERDGSHPRQLLPDNEHTGTLEYFDW